MLVKWPIRDFSSGHDVNTDFFACFGKASEDNGERCYETFRRRWYGQLYFRWSWHSLLICANINTSTLNICFCGQEKPPSYSGGWSYVTGSIYNQDISFKWIMSINTSRISSFHPSMAPNLCRGRISHYLRGIEDLRRVQSAPEMKCHFTDSFLLLKPMSQIFGDWVPNTHVTGTEV